MNQSVGEIPAYLAGPSSSVVPPPVTSRLQNLPYGKLAWEDFERLCLRCARTESDVVRVRLYGERGSAQAGIDLYARVTNGAEYRVYQCKNESEFGPTKIRDAVSVFLVGEWSGRAKEFVLCTRESLRSTGRTEEVERQAERLAKLGVTLRIWDQDELDVVLKSHPQIVHDFFSGVWCAAFCGEESARSLGSRLDGATVRELRGRLQTFYAALFATHDRGIPAAALAIGSAPALRERYVVPDILELRETASGGESDDGSGAADPPGGAGKDGAPRETATRGPASVRTVRVPIEGWLLGGRFFAIIGDFGLGKSTLLRFLALDVLSEKPRLDRLAVQWGEYLPIWVPFALWTRLVSRPETSATSLADLLRGWFHGLNEDRLWPLVEKALDDERLVLLVDGLDEWTDRTAASIAAQRLEVFVQQRGIPVVAAGRPAGFGRLGVLGDNWKTGRLAELSGPQQRELARHWVLGALEAEAGGEAASKEVRAESQVEEFMTELAQPELAELAKVPLLLSVLVFLKLQHVALPDSRFKAYDEMVRQLISVHPQRRRVAAGIDDDGGLTAEDAARVLGRVAYRIQCEFPEGALPVAQAISTAQEFAIELGFDPPAARKHARQLIESDGAATGLLSSRFGDDIGFFHRSFQEHLAARHLASMPFDRLRAVVANRCRDSEWHEVILATLRFVVRPDEIARLVESLETSPTNLAERHDLELLLADVCCGEYGAPAVLTKRLLAQSIEVIERGEWMPHRERMLTRVLQGLRQGPVRDQVRRKVCQWWPGDRWRADLYAVVTGWSGDDADVLDALVRGLYDEDAYNQRAAAAAIAARYAGRNEVGASMGRWALGALTPGVRAAALEGLAVGWPDHPDFPKCVAAARASRSPSMRWAGVFAMVRAGGQTDTDLNELMSLSRLDLELDFTRRNQTPHLLAEGWKDSSRLKSVAMRSHGSWYPRDREGIDRNHALEVLLRAFPQDPEVATVLGKEIEDNEHPFLGTSSLHLGWELLLENFAGQDSIVRALDAWIPVQKFHEVDLSYAALVGRTSVAKATLLAGLARPNAAVHWLGPALLDGWGMDDAEVAAALRTMTAPGTGTAVGLAHLMPRILGATDECYQRLLEMLREPDCRRPDFVFDGLRALGRVTAGSEALAEALRLYWDEEDDSLYGLGPRILALATGDPDVRKVAQREVSRRHGSITAVARAYGGDAELRSAVLDRMSPLPVRLRDMVVANLAERPIRDEFATARLALFDHEADAEVKVRASIGFHRRLARSGGITDVATQMLESMIACYGLDHDERRQAALCGLIALERLDLFADATERITLGPDVRTHTVDLSIRGREPNRPLVEYVAEHWVELQRATGGTLSARLSKGMGSREPWEPLSTVAAGYPALSTELLGLVEADETPSPGPAILDFIARVRPRSGLLRRYCFAALANQDVYADGAERAGELLGEHFRGDPGVLADLESQTSMNSTGKVIALCVGWSGSKEILATFKDAKEGRLAPRLAAQYALGFSIWKASHLPGWLLGYLDGEGPRVDTVGNAITRTLIARMRADPDAYQALLGAYMRRVESPSLQCSIPMLLGALGIGPFGREVLTRRLESESGKPSPEFGFDLHSGEVQSIVVSLLGALTGTRA